MVPGELPVVKLRKNAGLARPPVPVLARERDVSAAIIHYSTLAVGRLKTQQLRKKAPPQRSQIAQHASSLGFDLFGRKW